MQPDSLRQKRRGSGFFFALAAGSGKETQMEEQEKPQELTSKQQAVLAAKMVDKLKKAVPVRHQQVTILTIMASLMSTENERIGMVTAPSAELIVN